MGDLGDTRPYAAKNETFDLSHQLEERLNEQLAEDNIEGHISKEQIKTEYTPEQERVSPLREKLQEIPAEIKKEKKVRRAEGTEKDKTVSMINESKYLRYIAELRKADSELALAKAESAELVLQMNNYKEHYEEYEEIIQQIIREHDKMLEDHIRTFTGLSQSVQDSSDSLSSRIDGEIRRLTEALSRSIEGNVKKSCDDELARVEEATRVLYDYSEKVKEQYTRFQKLEKVKFGLFIISSVSAPIVLVLMILNMLHIL